MDFDIEEATILRCVGGSRAYGTNIAGSDLDIKGVLVAPLNFYLGFRGRFSQVEKYANKGHENDEVIYDIQKFFKLASGCNPNILDVLFCHPDDVLFSSEVGEELRSKRTYFISKKAKNTFLGYATAQLKKVEASIAYVPPSRMDLFEKYGYDTKHAAHLIRLLRMGRELLESGECNVRRPDAKELIEIRKGKYEFTELRELASQEESDFLKAYDRTELPDEPNYEYLDKLCKNLICHFHNV